MNFSEVRFVLSPGFTLSSMGLLLRGRWLPVVLKNRLWGDPSRRPLRERAGGGGAVSEALVTRGCNSLSTRVGKLFTNSLAAFLAGTMLTSRHRVVPRAQPAAECSLTGAEWDLTDPL